jgi:mRNA interferase YafQ
MRKLDRTNQFKRDFKKHGELEPGLIEVLYKLLNGEPLPEKYRDHALTGDLKDVRDCHIRPDLILLYRYIDDEWIQLIRIGTHSELGL